MKSIPATLAFLLLTLLVPFLPAVSNATAVVSRFNTDLEGWLIVGDNSGTWQGTGGNPGGCLAVNDLAIGQLNFASAPAKFLGDWSAMTASDSIRFDVHLVQQDGNLITGEWIFRIAGPGGAARGIVPGSPPPLNTWHTFGLPIAETSWVIESGSWSAIVAHVTSLKLLVEYVNGNEDVLVDNVRLTSAPVAVFTPCVYSDFNAGATLDDWSFAGSNGVTNPANGEGNGGGYLQVVDHGTYAGYAYAPARFLGSWLPLSGNGYVTLDVRVASFTGTSAGAAQFIRLSGPGGVAHVALAAGAVPSSDREWRTYTFPLSPGSWVIDSGTWTGLMAFVNEMRIDTDYYASGTIDFDNIGRMRNDCAAIDDNVTVHEGGTARCDRYTLVGVTGVARNPASNVLHGIVRDDGTKDGVYMLTGATPYTKLATYDRPAALIFDDDGDGYVSEDYGGNIYRFVGASSSLWVSGLHAGDDDPFGMTFVPAGFTVAGVTTGDVLVADRGNAGPDEVWGFSPDAAENEVMVTPDPGEVDWFDLTAGPGGKVYLADALQPNSLGVLSNTGVLGSLALSAPISSPYSIVYDSVDDALFVSSGGVDAVYRVNPTTGAVTLVADGFNALSLAGLEIDTAHRILWVTDGGYNRVYELCLPGAPTAVGDTPAVPALSLRAFPNPFNPSVRLSFDLAEAGTVTLEIFDVAGKRVRTVTAARLAAGPHELAWDGQDDRGHVAPSGVYFARLRHNGAVATVRLVRVR